MALYTLNDADRIPDGKGCVIDPPFEVFPATRMAMDGLGDFRALIQRRHWSSDQARALTWLVPVISDAQLTKFRGCTPAYACYADCISYASKTLARPKDNRAEIAAATLWAAGETWD